MEHLSMASQIWTMHHFLELSLKKKKEFKMRYYIIIIIIIIIILL
jgi:heme O synthase-like polyprenyltransferase